MLAMKILRVVGYVLLTLVLLAGAAFGYLYFRRPATAPPVAIKVDMSPEKVARGKYLFTLASCDGCHSELDFSKLGSPVVAGGRGKGRNGPADGLPGRIVASNITPDRETGIGQWSDGEKIRAIREGISRDGRPLFPMMPYTEYRRMSDSDVQSLVAYLNTLEPVKNQLPTTEVRFPISLMLKGVPQPVGSVPEKDRSNPVIWGGYLATVGGCEVCHTPSTRGQPDLDKQFAGGQKFTIKGLSVVTANITPHSGTGIGDWDLDRFVKRFREYRKYVEAGSPPAGPEKFTVMPWLNLSQLTDDDLAALYAFLRTVTPVENKIEKVRL